MRGVSLLAIVGAATLFLAASGRPHGIKEGGTLRVVAPGGFFGGVDPGQIGNSVDLLRPACGSLLAYPDEPLPAGLSLAPELAVSAPQVSADGKTYTLTIRKNARFSTGGAVTASDVVRSLERILTPEMQSSAAEFFTGILGARRVLDGKATRLAGAVAKGRTLTLRLKEMVPDFPSRLTHLCVVPASLPVDPEGAKAPLPSAAPYYVDEFLVNERLVLRRNRFYKGRRKHHVDRIVVELKADPATAVDRVARGEAEYVWPESLSLNLELADLARRYGTNKSQFFLRPSLAGRMFFLNTSRPLFKNNLRLRQALNFAVDRKALVREFGPYAATTTDQFLPPLMPGFRNERIYPRVRPDLSKARSLAAGRTRGGKAILYIRSSPIDLAAAQVLSRNLKALGLDVEVREFPTPVLFQKAQTVGEPFDIVLLGWQAAYSDPREILVQFDGRRVNYSRFNSPRYNRLLDEAARLSGAKRYDAYGQLDVKLAREAAPAIPYAVFNEWAFVSKKVGCIVLNPRLDLTAVCLK